MARGETYKTHGPEAVIIPTHILHNRAALDAFIAGRQSVTGSTDIQEEAGPVRYSTRRTALEQVTESEPAKIEILAAAPVPLEIETATPPAKPARGNHRVGRIAAGAVASVTLATGVGYVVNAQNEPAPAPDTCTDTTHRLAKMGIVDGPWNAEVNQIMQWLDALTPIKDGRSWTETADALSEKLGYYISPDRLAAVNGHAQAADTKTPVDLVEWNKDGSLEDRIRPLGTFCLNVPAPLAAGQTESDGKMTLKDFTAQYGVDEPALRKFNPGLPIGSDQPLPRGYVVWTTDKPDSGVVMRTMTEKTPMAAAHGDPKRLKEIADANIALIGAGKALQPGDMAYLPLEQTPDMKKEGVTPQQITEAHQISYDITKRSEDPGVPAMQPDKKDGGNGDKQPANPDVALTAEQQQIIESLPNLTKEKKQALASFVLSAYRVKDQSQGVNMHVLVAQAILESSWGQSELSSKYHNYFGMKANNNWKGAVTPPIPTTEYVNGVAQKTTAVFRAYPDQDAGFRGYIDNIVSKEWYNDARHYPDDDAKYLDGLLNQLDDKGNIVIAQGQDKAMSYATDPNYKPMVLDLINSLHLHDLMKRVEAAPARKTGPITLHPESYSSVQNPLPGNKSDGATLMYHGKEVLSRDLTYSQRVEMITEQLNGINVSAEGYNNFKLVDLTNVVPKHWDNFDGHQDHQGYPKLPDDIKYFIWHFTSTNTSATGYDGDKFAGSMQHSGSLGVQFNIRNDGAVYWLTKARAYHTLPWNDKDGDPTHDYNYYSYGMEISACEQAAISSAQYTNGIYNSVKFLVDNGYVAKDKSVTPLVNKMFKGHREANPAIGAHEDFPALVMDQIRPKIVETLVDLGYKA